MAREIYRAAFFYFTDMKFFLRFFVFSFLFFIPSVLPAGGVKSHEKHNQILSDFLFQNDLEEVLQSEYAKDSGWIFITARQKNHTYENLYAINEKEPEKSSLILENPAKATDVFSNLCYLPEFVLMKKKLRLIFLLMMEKAVIW